MQLLPRLAITLHNLNLQADLVLGPVIGCTARGRRFELMGLQMLASDARLEEAFLGRRGRDCISHRLLISHGWQPNPLLLRVILRWGCVFRGLGLACLLRLGF